MTLAGKINAMTARIALTTGLAGGIALYGGYKIEKSLYDVSPCATGLHPLVQRYDGLEKARKIIEKFEDEHNTGIYNHDNIVVPEEAMPYFVQCFAKKREENANRAKKIIKQHKKQLEDKREIKAALNERKLIDEIVAPLDYYGTLGAYGGVIGLVLSSIVALIRSEY